VLDVTLPRSLLPNRIGIAATVGAHLSRKPAQPLTARARHRRDADYAASERGVVEGRHRQLSIFANVEPR